MKQAVAIALSKAGLSKKKRKKMAKRSRKSKVRKNPKRVAAARKAYKKSGLYKHNLKRKRSKVGGRKKRYGTRKRKSSGRSRAKRYKQYSGSAVAARARFNMLVKRLEAKGHDPKTAKALALRAQKIMAHMKRGTDMSKKVEAEKAAQLANAFAGIGMAGHLAASAGQH